MNNNVFSDIDFGPLREFLDNDDITDISYSNNGQIHLKTLSKGIFRIEKEGINNALIEINIVLELKEQVILPFISKKIDIETIVPVALKLIQGSVPEYYFNGIEQNSPELTPNGPKAVPTGGAGVALPAGNCNVNFLTNSFATKNTSYK